MTLGKRQDELFVATDQLTRAPGHNFYRRLNELLAEVRFVEGKCKPFYTDNERPGILRAFFSNAAHRLPEIASSKDEKRIQMAIRAT